MSEWMKSKMGYTLHGQSGFTMVEVLIALLMSAIIMAAVYTSSKTQQDSYLVQDEVVSMQQNLRAAMLMMAREIRMAGYNPAGTANAGLTVANQGRFGFTEDLNGDGDTSDSNESVTFGFSTATDDTDGDGIADSGFASLDRDTGGGAQPISDNIHAVEFYYTMADGTKTLTPAAASLKDIREVQVTVLAQTAVADPKFNSSPSFTTPGGQTWTLPLGFRGRMASERVQCRNMGL